MHISCMYKKYVW